MTIYALQATGHTPGETFSFGCHVDGPPDSTHDALVAWQTALGDLWDHDSGAGNTVKSHVSTAVGIDDASAAELDPFTGKQVTREIGASVHVGTSLLGMLPHSVAVAVSLRTSSATRSGRGRFYLPPLDTDSLDAGRVLAAAQTAIVNASKEMILTLAGGGFTVVVYHRSDKTWTNVNRVDVGDVYDDQRRRRNKLVETRSTLSIP